MDSGGWQSSINLNNLCKQQLSAVKLQDAKALLNKEMVKIYHENQSIKHKLINNTTIDYVGAKCHRVKEL